jgi:hypothetical protein
MPNLLRPIEGEEDKVSIIISTDLKVAGAMTPTVFFPVFQERINRGGFFFLFCFVLFFVFWYCFCFF